MFLNGYGCFFISSNNNCVCIPYLFFLSKLSSRLGQLSGRLRQCGSCHHSGFLLLVRTQVDLYINLGNMKGRIVREGGRKEERREGGREGGRRRGGEEEENRRRRGGCMHVCVWSSQASPPPTPFLSLFAFTVLSRRAAKNREGIHHGNVT